MALAVPPLEGTREPAPPGAALALPLPPLQWGQREAHPDGTSELLYYITLSGPHAPATFFVAVSVRHLVFFAQGVCQTFLDTAQSSSKTACCF